MRYRKHMLLCMIITLFLLAAPAVFAEEAFALLPFKGNPPEIAADFFDILINMLPEYTSLPVWVANPDEPPPDIPPGGFPANVCPSPSQTRTALYAITGEVFLDYEFSGNYRIRLYLWNMEEKRLLISDELTAVDPQAGRKQMPNLLTLLLPWARRTPVIAEKKPVAVAADPPPQSPPAADSPAVIIQDREVEVEKEVFIEKPIEENWLYLGLRGGGGYSLWYSDFLDSDSGKSRDEISTFWSANAALHLAVHLFRYFEIQTEALFSADLDSFDYINFSLTVPLLLKLVFQDNRFRASMYTGAYMYIPVHQIIQTEDSAYQQFTDYKPGFPDFPFGFPGFTFGLSIGWKMGPGFLFVDGRFDYDGHWMGNFESDGIYYRNLVKVNIGYEWGLFKKKGRKK